MYGSSVEIIATYLSEAISAEQGFESRFRSCSKDGDDTEVQTSFERAADHALSHIELLGSRLEALNGSYSKRSALLAEVLAMAPKAAQLGRIAEERIAQNLIAGFSLCKSGRGMYQALQSVAFAAGDEQTGKLAGELSVEQEGMAEQLWRFLPSRSKIAFNVLTAGEIDPAIETRTADDRSPNRS